MGILMEVNSARVTMSCEELKTVARLGCGLIIGSDAHTPQRVGDFELASAAVTEAGVWSSVVNAKRE
jgi:putative hydrolase